MSQIQYHYWKWTKPVPITKSGRTNPSTDTIKQDIASEITHNVHNNNNKRAVCNERIASRYMVIQTPINPFLSRESYLDDLHVQDTFLRPKDSNIKEAE